MHCISQAKFKSYIAFYNSLFPNDSILQEGCGFKTTGDVTQVYTLDSTRHKPLCLAGTAEMSLAGIYVTFVMLSLW